MIRKIRLLILAGVIQVILVSTSIPQIFNHSITIAHPEFPAYLPKPDVPDSLRILAIMVQFQEDDNPLTTGNGLFDLSTEPQDIINPPPHDAEYFGYQLEFTRRYFKEVSGGRLHIDYTVWEQIFKLDGEMAEYSPPRGGDFKEIGNLFEESWQLAAEADEIPFEEYDTFVIFHAGVGRDIDLAALLGIDPKPQDIPSLFLNLESLRRIFGSDYEGVEVGENGFTITNSMILPETQNRVLDLITGPHLLQLGMNGLICAMVGSRIGLPDLFNTDTGGTAIGRFGLMDGQAMFSFMGLFPPEPSAWEKYFLGWLEPKTALPGIQAVKLPAHQLARQREGFILNSPEMVYRAPMNAREYYLIENRHRNPLGTGQTLTLIQQGEEVEYHVDYDIGGFNAFDVSNIYGVVVDAEVYDWSLPGGMGSNGEFYDGGILIWHIDENIIQEKIEDNRINADFERRGVRLVEADGSQDIGHTYPFLHPGGGSEEGTPFDFWFAGNPSPVYQNRFDDSTHPPAISNTGAPSNVVIYDFSERLTEMEVSIRIGSDYVSLIEGFPVTVVEPDPLASPIPFSFNTILVVENKNLVAFDHSGNLKISQAEKDIKVSGTPAWIESETGIYLYTRGINTEIIQWQVVENAEDLLFQHVVTVDVGEDITAGPAVKNDGTAIVGSDNGNVFQIKEDKYENVGSLSDGSVEELFLFDFDYWIAVGGSEAIGKGGLRWSFPDAIERSSAFIDEGGGGTVVLLSGEVKHRLDPQKEDFLSEMISVVTDESWGFPVSADLNRDGLTDFILPGVDKIHAFNQAGGSLDYFPVLIGDEILYNNYMVAADFDGSGVTTIAISNNIDLLYLIGSYGDDLNGTPLAIGAGIIGSPAVFPYEGRIALAIITDDNLLYAFEFPGNWITDSVIWGEERYNGRRTNVQETAYPRKPLSDKFLPTDRTYNWPNPVYDGVTFIRYYLGEDAEVNVSIYRYTGEKVAEFTGPGIGGTDNEIRWEPGNLQSGVYIGRVEAKSGARREVAFMKIAIVR